MCNLHNFALKNFVAKGCKSPKNLFYQNPVQQKKPVNDLSRTRNDSQAISAKYPNSVKKILQGEGSIHFLVENIRGR